jgi:hypothetical protein
MPPLFPNYTIPNAVERTDVPAEALAELYADPKTKVVSFWTMGFNQRTRGVWANNLVYNVVRELLGFQALSRMGSCGKARKSRRKKISSHARSPMISPLCMFVWAEAYHRRS